MQRVQNPDANNAGAPRVQHPDAGAGGVVREHAHALLHPVGGSGHLFDLFGPSIRPICTRYGFTMTNMIQVWGPDHVEGARAVRRVLLEQTLGLSLI